MHAAMSLVPLFALLLLLRTLRIRCRAAIWCRDGRERDDKRIAQRGVQRLSHYSIRGPYPPRRSRTTSVGSNTRRFVQLQSFIGRFATLFTPSQPHPHSRIPHRNLSAAFSALPTPSLLPSNSSGDCGGVLLFNHKSRWNRADGSCMKAEKNEWIGEFPEQQ